MRLTYLYEQVAGQMQRLDPAPKGWRIEVTISPDPDNFPKPWPINYQFIPSYISKNRHSQDLRKRLESRGKHQNFTSAKELIMWVTQAVDRIVLDDSKNIEIRIG